MNESEYRAFPSAKGASNDKAFPVYPPEVERPEGVAPFWRVLAIVAAIGVIGLMLLTFVMGIALMARRAVPQTAVATAWPMPAGPGPQGENEGPLPFPTQADLAQQDRQPVFPGEEPPPPPGQARTTRDRLLARGREVWKNPGGGFYTVVTVSPDGQNLACIDGDELLVGPPGNLRSLAPPAPGMAPRPGMPPGPAMPGGPPQGPFGGLRKPTPQPVGVPTWSADSRYVFFADVGGRMYRCDILANNLLTLPFQGDSPAPLPPAGQAQGEPSKIVFVRSKAVAKADAPGAAAALDPTEVVLGDLRNPNDVRVLVPSSPTSWSNLAVAPNGKWLALVGDRGLETKLPAQKRVFLVNLDGGEPKPVSPPAFQIGPLTWAWVSTGLGMDRTLNLVYSRSLEPAPPDHWEEPAWYAYRWLDVFQWNVRTEQETRLTRGGGFWSASATANGLYCMTQRGAGAERNVGLWQIDLATCYDFARQEPEKPIRDAAAWKGLAEDVLKQAGLTADADGAQLTPETCRKVADLFRPLYAERFKCEPPASRQALGRLREEIGQLTFARPVQAQLRLVLGVVEGEYLRRRHGAKWHLVKGPLVPPPQAAPDGEEESPFGWAVNPFAFSSLHDHWAGIGMDDLDEELLFTGLPLTATLRYAAGRTVVLTNDPAAGRAAVAALTDPALAEATKLLKENQAARADKQLRDLTQKHPTNDYLTLHVGKLLYDHGRRAALRELMEPLTQRPPQDARKYNLLGLGWLDDNPARAVECFKNALRCDLRYGPGYLNLAQAYENNGDPVSARRCLERYLELLPYEPHAAGARRRLAALPGGPAFGAGGP